MCVQADAMLQNIYNQYIPSLRSLFKESMIGFRKVVMVGFSLENHSPASIIFFLENLYQQNTNQITYGYR